MVGEHLQNDLRSWYPESSFLSEKHVSLHSLLPLWPLHGNTEWCSAWGEEGEGNANGEAGILITVCLGMVEG